MSKVRWFTEQSYVEAQAVDQVMQTASMPFVRGLAVMPDVHFGKGSTVGTVIATKGAVMPAAVGVDIGCGMIAAETHLTVDAVDHMHTALREGIERRIPLGIGGHGMNSKISDSAEAYIQDLEAISTRNWGDPNYMNRRAKDWRLQLGSLGGGNHFIELCEGTPIMPEEIAQAHCGDSPSTLWITLHSGSRGVGNRTGTFWTQKAQAIAKKYMYETYLPNRDLAYLSEHTEEYWEYMKELFWCQKFAEYNREEMLNRIVRELSYALDIPEDAVISEPVNCHHNYVSKENYDGENFLITRKGAISARVGERALIPGSMGTPSYVVTGLGNEGAYNSAPHGAGRKMSRTMARKTFTLDALEEHMNREGIECRVRSSILDEHPGAYKDIEMVMFDSRHLVRPTHSLKQFINIKGD